MDLENRARRFNRVLGTEVCQQRRVYALSIGFKVEECMGPGGEVEVDSTRMVGRCSRKCGKVMGQT